MVHARDCEGLTLLLRLRVRYFVTLGENGFSEVEGEDALSDDLNEVWQKTMLLLRASYYAGESWIREAVLSLQDFCNCGCNNCQNCLLSFYLVSTMQGSENSIAIKLFIAMKCCNSNIALCILNYEMEML